MCCVRNFVLGMIVGALGGFIAGEYRHKDCCKGGKCCASLITCDYPDCKCGCKSGRTCRCATP